MNNAPTVTVLMSVYNGERYLREAIESILNQTFTDFEFLIINDGSTDASRSIISSYSDLRIQLIDNSQNIGLVKSLNRGLTLAQGRYIARQDADDISEPDRLARQVAFMDANPHLVMSGTWYREIDMDGNLGNNVRLPTEFTELQWALLFFCPFVHTAVIMCRSQLLQEIGLYNKDCYYAEDYELWLRIARHLPMANLPAYLVRYRTNPYSMTATYGEKTHKGIELSLEAIAPLLGWAANKQMANERCFQKMFAVMYGEGVTLNFTEVLQTTTIIWQLHQAFCKTYQLSEQQSSQHRAKVRAWLSRRYVIIAIDYVSRGSYTQAQQLYRRALHLHLPTFFTIKSARFLCRLLLVQPVKTLWSQVQSR